MHLVRRVQGRAALGQAFLHYRQIAPSVLQGVEVQRELRAAPKLAPLLKDALEARLPGRSPCMLCPGAAAALLRLAMR